MRVFYLIINKEVDGDWSIELPSYPFAHHNLMMVAGTDLLCEYVPRLQGRRDRAGVEGVEREALTSWFFPVTLLIQGSYPRKITLYLPVDL